MVSDDRESRKFLDDHSSSGYKEGIRLASAQTESVKATKIAGVVVAAATVVAIYVLSYLRNVPADNHGSAALLAAVAQTGAEPLKDGVDLWEETAWRDCVVDYKNAYNSARAIKSEEPPWYRYYDGQCAEELPNIPDGVPYLMVHGPSDFFNSSGFEITLNVNNSGSNETICSNRAGRYAEWFESQMKSESRCKQFPELLALRMDKKRLTGNREKKAARSLDGRSACLSTVLNGMPKKYVTYEERGRTYAINGSARDIASGRRWLDGKSHFSVEQMQQLLARGLAACD
ncbi:hypothetical protein [Pseudoduganella violaceinigra]|uniref:hypothetical protein n=1 Tax=Pseudoduganella violaceinigra TaxID=246602 RepID=UPI000484B0D0|nr:hypothetical protein [Pseudoduganella violaceinigra]